MGAVDTFRRDGLTFDVRDSGPADGPVVVCLHGFPQDASSFDALTPLLVRRGLRVLAPDQRGYSPGARPRGRSAYVQREVADDVAALLDAAGVERAHLVGHDWGGVVAWTFATHRTERTLSLTALAAPHPGATIRSVVRSTQSLRSSYMAVFQLPWVPERLLLADDGAVLRRALVESGLDAPRADHYTRRMQEPGALTAALNWYRAIPLSRGYVAGEVQVPTALVHGRHDRFFTPAAVRGTGSYVRGPLRTVRLDTGHWIAEQAPEPVADAVLRLVRHVETTAVR
jgi:pimeloyl-ACP methyl ester carboxylesterase